MKFWRTEAIKKAFEVGKQLKSSEKPIEKALYLPALRTNMISSFAYVKAMKITKSIASHII